MCSSKAIYERNTNQRKKVMNSNVSEKVRNMALRDAGSSNNLQCLWVRGRLVYTEIVQPYNKSR